MAQHEAHEAQTCRSADGAEFSSDLVTLCGLIGGLLGGSVPHDTLITDAVVELAVNRHQVGSMFYSAVLKGNHSIGSNALERLQRAYADSAQRRQAALLRLESVRASFAAQGIAWMALKGALQAERLYPDPAWRTSSDIDILVEGDKFGHAIDALTRSGFISSNPPILIQRFLRVPLLRAIHEVTLIADDERSCAIEVHRRLFFAVDRPFPALSVEAGPIPTPALNPELVLYLIAHGAISMWVRLKWLIDLVPAITKLGPIGLTSLRELAERAGIVKSTAASLLLLRALFPFVPIDPLMPWLAECSSLPGVQNRIKRYRDMLELSSDWKRSPMDNTRAAFEANFLLWERPTARLRVAALGPVSSLARKIAASLNRDDRRLTLSHAPVMQK
jgi:hypothetical protein